MTVNEFINSVPELAEQSWESFAGVTELKGKLEPKTLWAAIAAVHGPATKRQGTDRYWGNILVQVDRGGFVQLADMN